MLSSSAREGYGFCEEPYLSTGLIICSAVQFIVDLDFDRSFTYAPEYRSTLQSKSEGLASNLELGFESKTIWL